MVIFSPLPSAGLGERFVCCLPQQSSPGTGTAITQMHNHIVVLSLLLRNSCRPSGEPRGHVRELLVLFQGVGFQGQAEGRVAQQRFCSRRAEDFRRCMEPDVGTSRWCHCRWRSQFAFFPPQSLHFEKKPNSTTFLGHEDHFQIRICNLIFLCT